MPVIENAQRMSCGNCGFSKFQIYQTPKGLVVECLECNSTTEVQARATLWIEECENSRGCLCILNRPAD
jgi:hypothetical protein